MSRLSAATSNRIYDVLVKYADANTDPVQREGFIYEFSVYKNPMRKFEVLSDADKPAEEINGTFYKNDGEYWYEGIGSEKVNVIVKKIISDEVSGS